MKPSENIEKQLKNMNVTPALDRDRQILDAVLQAQAQTNKQTPADFMPNIWSIIMKAKITKLTAAAMLFIAVIFGVKLIPGTNGPVALAGIIETFKNAPCISYDLKIGDNSPFMHDTVYQNRIRREKMGATLIIDLQQQRILTLLPQNKQAISIDTKGMKGLPEDISNPKVNYVDRLVNLLTEIQKEKKYKIEQLEPKDIDGQILTGVLAKSQKDNVEVEIWMAPKTTSPVQVIEKRPGLAIIMKNFNFHEVADPSLFSMDLPEGYTLIDGQNMIDFKKDATEENFISLLKMLAESNDGWFPQDISVEYIVKYGADIGSQIEKTYEGTMKRMQATMLLSKGMTFLRFYQGQGLWHYAGNGVQLGQSETPIFWYQPKDSDMFRVIFGDLHVEEVLPEDVEALVSDRVALSGFGYQLWDKPEVITHQEDELYIKADNILEVHSKIDIRKGPMNLSRVNLALPYKNAELISATFGDAGLPYDQDENGQYSFYPDGKQILAGEHVINLIWQFPLKNLKQTDYGYEFPIQTFISATSYKLTVILEPDCGFTWSLSPEYMEKGRKLMPSREPDNPRMLTVFSVNSPKSKTTFGTSGLCIKPE